METRNIKISKTEKCKTGNIRRVYKPKLTKTKTLSEQNTMSRIQKAGTRFERINFREVGEETIFIPNNSENHISYSGTLCQVRITIQPQTDVPN